MGQIASAQPEAADAGPTSTWDDVDDMQTQPIDIPHFLQRAEAEAGYWKDLTTAQIQPIQFLGKRLTVKHSRKFESDTKPVQLPALSPIMTPVAAFLAMPQLMNEHWIYPLCALITNADSRTAEMAMAALSSIIDSPQRQSMAVEANAVISLVTHFPAPGDPWGSATASLQRVAFDALTALCRDNRNVSLDVVRLCIVDRIVDVCAVTATTSILQERKASALQTLLELLKLDELKHELAGSPTVATLVQLITHPHPAIAFHALGSLSELFLCQAARDAAIAAGVLPLLLTCLVSATLPNSNKTLILQATYALSILATHVAEAFPLDASVTAICHVMEILRGALKRSRLASLVCMFVTGLSWRRPACHRFQVALRERPSPNLFAILASLLIGGSNDVLCAASIAVAALSRDAPESALAFVHLDVHVTLTKLLSSKDHRVATSAAMALHRFLQPYQLERVVADRIRPTPWQVEMTSTMYGMGAMPTLLETILSASPLRLVPTERPASAYEIQATLAFFGFAKDTSVWISASTVQKMLQFTHVAANELLLELLLFFQLCTAPATVPPREFADLFVANAGIDILQPLLATTSPVAYVLAVLTTWRHLAFVYYNAVWPVPPDRIVDMLLAILELCAHVQDIRVLAAAMFLLDVLTEAKCSIVELTLRTLLSGDAHRISNMLFLHKEDIQCKAGLVLGRLVRFGKGAYLPLPSALAQLIVLLESPSHDVAYAASHSWGNLLILPGPLAYFGAEATTAVASLLHLFSTQKQAKYLRDASRTLFRASKSMDVQAELLHSGMALLEALCRHPLDVVGHHAILTLTEMGKTPIYRPSVLSPPIVLLLDSLVAPATTTPRDLQNQLDALYFIAHVCVDAASQHTLLRAKVVDHTMALVLMTGPMGPIKLAALTALATLCSADEPTREHILSEPIVAAVLGLLDILVGDETELLVQCLLALLHMLDAPRAQGLIGKSPLLGNVVQTLQVPADRVRSLTCQVLAKLAHRCDSMKADMARMDAINILLNLVCIEPRASRVQRDALHALAELVETASPASKTNKHELFDLPQSMQLTKMLAPPNAADDADVETTGLVLAVLANATYQSPRNQRLLQAVEMDIVQLMHVFFTARPATAYHERVAIEALRVLANLAAHQENRRSMGHDALLFRALLLALQSDVAALHRFSALTMAHLATGNDEHRIAMGSFGGLLPALAERLNSKDPLVLENVCFAITKLGAHGGNQFIFGANLVFERLLPLAVHNAVVVQKMAVNAIAVLIESNDKNKAALVDCNAIPILCGLVNQHDSIHTRVLECAMQSLAGLVATQVIEVSKFLDPHVVIALLSSVNAKLQRTSLTMLASLTKESFNKVRFGEQSCMEAVVCCLNSHLSTGERCENEAMPSLLDSEADLVLVELAATALANLSFEPLNTTAIIQANTSFSCVQRLGELIDAALVLSYETSPQKPHKTKGPSPKKPSNIGTSNNNHDDDGDSKVAIPLLITRPMQCAHILEQCALIVNNCAHAILAAGYVTEDLVGTVCMMLAHASDLVKKCACFTLTVWCSKVEMHQAWVMNQPGVLTTLIGLLNSSTPSILEAALWVLTKLSGYRDNHIQMANCDIVRILEGLIFRFHTLIGSGVLDRAIRLLGNLALNDAIRSLVKCEGLVAGPLHSILDHQLQPLTPASAQPILHCKNIARLMGILLSEDALKLFFPKKTLSLLKRIYIAETSPVKVRRNIVLVFFLLSAIEEHRFAVASAEKDSPVPRLVQALAQDEHELLVRANILAMFSLWSQHEGLCHLLFLCDIAETLLKYMVVTEYDADHYAAVIVHHLSSLKEQVRKRLAMEGTTELVLSLLKQCVEAPVASDPFAYSCAGILANLTVHDDAKVIVVNVGGLPTLLAFFALKIDDVVRGSDRSILDILAKVLANLSFDDACKKGLLALSTVALVLQVLQRRLVSFVGIENYVLCLGNLSTVAEAIGQLEDASAIPTLFALLEEHATASPWVAKCVIWAVSNMVMHSTKAKYQILDYPGGLSLVLSLLVTETSKQTDTIIECTMTCLSCIAAEKPIAEGLAACSTIAYVLRFLEPDVRQSLQRKAVKTINSLATFGFADYITNLSHSHTRLLSIASEGHQSIAPTAMAALRRISHLRNESPEVLCSNVNGIDALLQLLHSGATSTVLDALHLLHHIAVVTAPILCNAQYFAARNTCTQATALLDAAPSTEMADGVVRLATFLIANSLFDMTMATDDEDWPRVLSRLARWWSALEPDVLATHELTPMLLTALDSFMRDASYIHATYDASVLSPASLGAVSDCLLRLVKTAGEPADRTLHGTRALVHLACASEHYQSVLAAQGLPSQLRSLLLAVPPTCGVPILLVLMQGIKLYAHNTATKATYMDADCAKALLALVVHVDHIVAARALEIVHMLLTAAAAQNAFRSAHAVAQLTAKLRCEGDATNRVRLLQSLVHLWDAAESTVAAFTAGDAVLLVVELTPCLREHTTDTLVLLQCLSTAVAFHSPLFTCASTLLQRLQTRTKATSVNTVLVLRILCNMCWAPVSFMLPWVDAGMLAALLPLSQWVLTPFQSEHRAATVPEATWEAEVELVLRLLARVTYDGTLRHQFRDGADIPDLLALLKPPAQPDTPWAALGMLENAAETVANLALEKDLQIMLIVEDGVTFMAQLLLLLPPAHTTLARNLVRAMHNLSYDLEVQAILAAQNTFPYFVSLVAALGSATAWPPPRSALDGNASHCVEAMAACIVHDISATVQWVDGLVAHGAQKGLVSVLTHRQLPSWGDAAIDLESLVLDTLANLSHTAHLDTLVADGVGDHLAQVVLRQLPVPGEDPRRQRQFGRALHGLSMLSARSPEACKQLAATLKCQHELAAWLVTAEAAPLDDQVAAIALLASQCTVEAARHAVAGRALPLLLGRVAAVAMAGATPDAGQVAALSLLAHLLGPDIDSVDQHTWDYTFVEALGASVVLHTALSSQLNADSLSDGLQLLHGCLRHTRLTTHRLPTSLWLLVVAAWHASSTPTTTFRHALGILEIGVDAPNTRRQLAETQVLEAIVMDAGGPSLALPPVLELLRKLLGDAMEIYVERDPIIVGVIAGTLTMTASSLLGDMALAFLGHLALSGGVLQATVVHTVQAEMRLVQCLSRHVEHVHATTCSRASVNVARHISYEDMLRVYLFALSFRRHLPNLDKPLTPGSQWMTDRSIASCFIMDILTWFSTDVHSVTRRFAIMYPDLLLATASLVELAYPRDVPSAPLPGVCFFDHIQEDILQEMLVILTAATPGTAIPQACITALIDINAWWGTDTLVVALLQAMPAKPELLANLAALLTLAPTPTLRFMMLMVTTDALVEDLKALGVKAALEVLSVESEADKSMVSALLNLLGYSVDLSLAFVANLERFSEFIDDPLERSQLMAAMKTTLAMNVVTDPDVLALVLPRLVYELTRDAAFLDDVVLCLAHFVPFECFADHCVEPATVLRVYIERFHACSNASQTALMDVLVHLHEANVPAEAFGYFVGAAPFQPLDQLLVLAASLLGANVAAAARMLHLVWLHAMHDKPFVALLAQRAELLTPFVALLLGPPPVPRPGAKKGPLHAGWTPAQIAQFDLVQLIQLIAGLKWSPIMLEGAASLFNGLVEVLGTFAVVASPKLQALQTAYLGDLAKIVLRFAIFLTADTFVLDDGLKALVGYLDVAPTARLLQLNLYQLVASLSKLPAAVLAMHRLQCLEALVHRFPKVPMDVQLYVLATMANAARTGLESEVVSRLSLEADALAALLKGLATYTREPQAHAAYLLSTLLLHYPDLGGSVACVTTLIESLEAVDMVVVQHVLVSLSAILHVEPTQETLLRHATVPVLAQILQKGDYVSTEHVLRILAILCAKHPAVCRRVVAANLLGILIATVRNASEVESRLHDVYHAAWVLSCISKDKDLAGRIEDADDAFIGFLLDAIENFTLKTLNKLLRVLGNVWNHTPPRRVDIVAPFVTRLLAILPRCDDPTLLKNGVRVLCVLFLHPVLEETPELIEALAQCFFGHLHTANAKLVVFSLHALTAGVVAESLPEHLIRAHFDVQENVLQVLHLVVPDAFDSAQNRLGGVLQFLNAIATDDATHAMLAPLVVPPLLHVLEATPAVRYNAPTIKETLALLSTLTRTASPVLSLTPLLVAALKQLLELLHQDDAPTTMYYADALHVLVNWAVVAELRQSLVLHGGLGLLLESFVHGDDTHLPLVLLGIASLSGDALAKQTIDFTPIVPKLMRLMVSSHATVQATCVWIISNISNLDAVRRLINAQNGASVLQSLLNEVTNPALLASRPVSSSKRIRDHAPQALKDLGFMPLNPH
ncbi:hypothetical protein ACHHYP_07981 [Achlya hypogyna]|uniref:Vacuolar protein 8 n=1 Tax=Achlya hypogyna TaxID=1202772 RepID=A0A1V9YQ33_ACHHY|nr:hypothetical protein ACHHYP_07981 [Achlya hypogyna]